MISVAVIDLSAYLELHWFVIVQIAITNAFLLYFKLLLESNSSKLRPGFEPYGNRTLLFLRCQDLKCSLKPLRLSPLLLFVSEIIYLLAIIFFLQFVGLDWWKINYFSHPVNAH